MTLILKIEKPEKISERRGKPLTNPVDSFRTLISWNIHWDGDLTLPQDHIGPVPLYLGLPLRIRGHHLPLSTADQSEISIVCVNQSEIRNVYLPDLWVNIALVSASNLATLSALACSRPA